MVWAVRVAGVFRSGAPSCVLLSGAAATVVDRGAFLQWWKMLYSGASGLRVEVSAFLPSRFAKEKRVPRKPRVRTPFLLSVPSDGLVDPAGSPLPVGSLLLRPELPAQKLSRSSSPSNTCAHPNRKKKVDCKRNIITTTRQRCIVLRIRGGCVRGLPMRRRWRSGGSGGALGAGGRALPTVCCLGSIS